MLNAKAADRVVGIIPDVAPAGVVFVEEGGAP